MNGRHASRSTHCRATSRRSSSELIKQATRCVSHSLPFEQSNRTIASSLVALRLSWALSSALALTRLQLRSLVRLLRLAQDRFFRLLRVLGLSDRQRANLAV